jgi:hypothetical protein
MVRVKYCPQKQLYDDYYIHSGGNYPVFQGSLIQKGYGLGGIISGLARMVIPLIKSGVQRAIPLVKKGALELGKHALTRGAKSLSDVILQKKTGKKTLKRQYQQMRENLPEVITVKPPAKKKRKRKRHENLDIFA